MPKKIFNMHVWLDGVCKKCGSLVIETSADDNPEFSDCDYMNQCSNPYCENHKWHYIGDMEQLDYYEHDSKIYKRIIITPKKTK